MNGRRVHGRRPHRLPLRCALRRRLRHRLRWRRRSTPIERHRHPGHRRLNLERMHMPSGYRLRPPHLGQPPPLLKLGAFLRASPLHPADSEQSIGPARQLIEQHIRSLPLLRCRLPRRLRVRVACIHAAHCAQGALRRMINLGFARSHSARLHGVIKSRRLRHSRGLVMRMRRRRTAHRHLPRVSLRMELLAEDSPTLPSLPGERDVEPRPTSRMRERPLPARRAHLLVEGEDSPSAQVATAAKEAIGALAALADPRAHRLAQCRHRGRARRRRPRLP